MYVSGQHMVSGNWSHNTGKIWLRPCLQAVACIQIEDIDKFGVEPAWEKESLLKWTLHYNQPEGAVYSLDRKWESFQLVVSLVFKCHPPQACTNHSSSFLLVFLEGGNDPWVEATALVLHAIMACHQTICEARTLEENENVNSCWNWSKGP